MLHLLLRRDIIIYQKWCKCKNTTCLTLRPCCMFSYALYIVHKLYLKLLSCFWSWKNSYASLRDKRHIFICVMRKPFWHTRSMIWPIFGKQSGRIRPIVLKQKTHVFYLYDFSIFSLNIYIMHKNSNQQWHVCVVCLWLRACLPFFLLL